MGELSTEGLEVRIPGSKQLAALLSALEDREPLPSVVVDQSGERFVRTLELRTAFITTVSIARDGTGTGGPSDGVTFYPSEVRRTIGEQLVCYDFALARDGC